MKSNMKVYVMFALILLSVLNVSVSILNGDEPNRIYKPLNNFPMRCGGGYPSTTGNPSGGGRWND